MTDYAVLNHCAMPTYIVCCRLAQEMGLREDVTAKGKRTRRMPLSSYNAGLCDQGQEAYTAGSGSCPTSPLASRRPATATHRGAVTPADSAGDAASETVGASAAWGQSEAKASGLVDASGPETAGLQLRCKSAKALTMPDMNSSSDSPIADGAGQPSLTALSSALPGLSYGRRGGGEGLSSIPLGTPSALSGAPATSTHGMASHALGSHALDVSVEADEDLVEVLHEAGRCTHSFPAAASPGPRDQSPLGASNLRPAALAAKDVSTVATHHRFASFSSLQETISDGDAVTDLSRPDSAASHAHSPLHSSVLGTAADDVAAGLGALQILEVSSNEDAASDPAAAEGANGVSSSAEGGLDEEQDMVFVPAYDRQSADRRLGQLRSNYERRSLDLGCHDQSVAYYAGRPSLQLTLPTHWEAPGAERAAQQDDSNC